MLLFAHGSVLASKRFAFALLLLVPASFQLGCGAGGSLSGGGTPIAPPAATLAGRVVSGTQPISGATVQMYAAGGSGMGSAATALLATAAITDAAGNFSAGYTCPAANAQIYLAATGGNPGLAAGTNNPSIALVTALGSCGDLSSSGSVVVNEVTTAAAAWALAPFMVSLTAVGTTSTNAQGLQNAFATANLLADTATGVSPSSTLASNLSIESAKVYSLANVLSGCVRSTGGSPCAGLFSLATPSGAVSPVNTLEAALKIVTHPGNQVAALYGVASVGAPYAGLPAAPSDWTMSVIVSGGGLSIPATVAVDSKGRLWVANYSGAVSAFTSTGVPVFPAGLVGSGLGEVYGLAIDPSGNVWATNESAGTVSKFTNDGNPLSGSHGFGGGGILAPIAVASDAVGNIWVVNYGNSSVTRLSNAGVPDSPTAYTGSNRIDFPVAVAVDSSNTPWIADQTGSITHLSATGALLSHTSCCGLFSGVAVDASGNVWGTDYLEHALVRLSASTGALLSQSTAVGGLRSPSGVAVDGAGTIWVSNSGTNSLSEFAGAGGTAPIGSALSPASGFGLDAGINFPFGLAIDGSGSIWMSSVPNGLPGNGNASKSLLVEFVGLAIPVKTPLLAPPTLP